MADIVEQDPRAANKLALIIVGVTALLNGAFFGLSGAYFADRAQVYGPVSDAEITSVRISFAVLTIVLAVAAVAAVRMPRMIGHAIPLIASLAAFAAAIASQSKGMFVVTPAALFVIGLLLPLLAWKSFERKRAGWAFLCGMCAMLAVVTLFGATKVRGVLGISLWHAMIIPGLFAIGTAALAMVRTEYRES